MPLGGDIYLADVVLMFMSERGEKQVGGIHGT